MKNSVVKSILILLVFFLGTSGLIMVDTYCSETTKQGGFMSLNIEKDTHGGVTLSIFNQNYEI
ncbi:MAG: hypothetical protein RSD88_01015 [Anaerovoracaceae bacterium]